MYHIEIDGEGLYLQFHIMSILAYFPLRIYHRFVFVTFALFLEWVLMLSYIEYG